MNPEVIKIEQDTMTRMIGIATQACIDGVVYHEGDTHTYKLNDRNLDVVITIKKKKKKK